MKAPKPWCLRCDRNDAGAGDQTALILAAVRRNRVRLETGGCRRHRFERVLPPLEPSVLCLPWRCATCEGEMSWGDMRVYQMGIETGLAHPMAPDRMSARGAMAAAERKRHNGDY